MSFDPHRARKGSSTVSVQHREIAPVVANPCGVDFKRPIPPLVGPRVTLREPRLVDAPALLKHLSDPEVHRYIPPGPDSLAGYRRFIRWAQRERRGGRYISWVVCPRGGEPSGVFQLWAVEPGFGVAEWGFVLGRACWGTGLFVESAHLLIDFAVEMLGTRRLEARAAVDNERGNAALRKLGAVPEGVLRQCFICQGRAVDHVLWAILADEWRHARAAQRRVH
jgi:RimJ/RimL family protein N-acetyltransferase